jgi:zinc protease
LTRPPKLAPRLFDCRLDNGLRLVMLPDRSSSLVAVNLWYHVGSRNDPQGLSGLAHLFEHMLFQGSENVEANEHFQLVQQVGGATNASTSFDRTNYYETLPPHCMELGLWLESDRMGYLLPALDEEKFEGQRSVVMNERLQRVDNQPYGRAFEALQEAIYRDGHPYMRPIIGSLADIRRASMADAADFFRRYYSPANAVLSLVGDFDPKNAERLVKAYFEDIGESGTRPEPPATVGDAARSSAAETTQLEDDVALSRLYLAWRGPALAHQQRYAGEILAMALGGGKSSPLYQDLVHRNQLAQDISVFLLTLELESLFIIVATAKPDGRISDIEERLDRHLASAAGTPLASDDLNRARNQVTTSLFGQMESVETLADLLSEATTFYDDPAAVDAESARYLECTDEDLTEFAARFLAPDRAARVRVVPRPARSTPS